MGRLRQRENFLLWLSPSATHPYFASTFALCDGLPSTRRMTAERSIPSSATRFSTDLFSVGCSVPEAIGILPSAFAKEFIGNPGSRSETSISAKNSVATSSDRTSITEPDRVPPALSHCSSLYLPTFGTTKYLNRKLPVTVTGSGCASLKPEWGEVCPRTRAYRGPAAIWRARHAPGPFAAPFHYTPPKSQTSAGTGSSLVSYRRPGRNRAYLPAFALRPPRPAERCSSGGLRSRQEYRPCLRLGRPQLSGERPHWHPQPGGP